MGRVAAGLEPFTDGVRVLAVDAPGVTEARAPAAGGVLDHANVIEGALGSIEVGIGPHSAKAVEAAAAGAARPEVDARSVGWVTCDLVHALFGASKW